MVVECVGDGGMVNGVALAKINSKKAEHIGRVYRTVCKVCNFIVLAAFYQ